MEKKEIEKFVDDNQLADSFDKPVLVEELQKLVDKAREEGVREYIEPKLVEIEEKILLIEEHLRDTSQMPAEVLGDMKRNLSILNAEKGRLFIDLRKYS